MGGIVIVIIVGAILASMGAGMFMYTEYQTNYISAVSGETITVGPVEYVITFEGTHNGSKEVVPENVFVMIGISAKIPPTTPRMTGQFCSNCWTPQR